MHPNKRQGHDYEHQAWLYLENQGLTCIARNVYCKGGEIDLVALDHHTLVFVEVKYRRSADYGYAQEYVTPQKQQRLQRCAQLFLQRHTQYQAHAIRFDVLSQTGTQLDWIKNAFGTW